MDFFNLNPFWTGITIVVWIVIYFIKSNVQDLLLRFLAKINIPLDYIVNFLKGSYSSLTRLNYRQKVINFVIVIVAIIMLISEYGTLNAIINAESIEGTIPIFGYALDLGTFAAVAYVTIATLLGFIAFELLNLKRIFQKILYNELEENARINGKNLITKRIVAIILLLALLLLAYYQGKLAILRYEKSSTGTVLVIVKSFYFLLGFLTPITAALALLSFDIYIAMLAMFCVTIIEFIQKFIAAFYLAFEAFLKVYVSPIVKVIELFGRYQKENFPYETDYSHYGKKKPKLVGREAPIINRDQIYLNNRALLLSKIYKKKSFTFVLDEPPLVFELPNTNFKIDFDTRFQSVVDFIKRSIGYLLDKNLTIEHLTYFGYYNHVDANERLNDYLDKNSVFIVSIENPNEKTQSHTQTQFIEHRNQNKSDDEIENKNRNSNDLFHDPDKK